MEPINIETPVHDWFSLSYASYYTIPRSILQSCSVATQKQFIAAVNAVEDEAERNGIKWPMDDTHNVEVRMRSMHGFFVSDPLADYQRGRLRLWEAVEVDDDHIPDATKMVNGWKPIETAPRNGTPFLAYSTMGGYSDVVRFDSHSKKFSEEGYHMEDGYFTHWMPLPKPPKEELNV